MKSQKFLAFCFIIFSSFFSKNILSQDNLFQKKDQAASLEAQIQKKLKKNSRLLKHIGLAVSDVSFSEDSLSQKENFFYFAHDEKKLFIPASLSKIATASALFHYFKPSHQFETSFVSEKKPDEEGNLKANLYLKGGGDPSFVSESLWNLVNNLKRSGVKHIEGDLVLDDSLFKNVSKKEFSSDRSYNSHVSALSFNWNVVNVYIRPGRKLHQPARVFIDPSEGGGYIQVKNRTQTKGRVKKIRVQRRPGSQGDIIQAAGSLPLDAEEYVVYKNVTQPVLWAGGNAQEFLRRRGILIKGRMLRGKSPSSFHVLASHKGRTLFQLVQDMMKFSSNFTADMLAFQLSLLKGEEKGSLEKGVQWIRAYIERQGIKNYVFESPSGLSRKNRLTAGNILKLLLKDVDSPYSYEKMTSYALAGGQGTLQSRFKNLKPNLVIRAKTGLLSGVVGIAGYVRSPTGRYRAFAFIYNGSKGKLQNQAQKFFDELVVLIAEY